MNATSGQPALWFYAIDRSQLGPVDTAALSRLIADATITRDTLVWREGMPSWQPAASCPDLAGFFITPQAQPTAPEAPEAEPPQSPVIAPAAPPTIAGPVTRASEITINPQAYAGFLRRVGAHLLDGVLCGMICLVGIMLGSFLLGILIFLVTTSGSSGNAVSILGVVIIYIVPLIIAPMYYILQEGGEHQATWGKRAFGMRLISLSGTRVTYGLAFGRFLAKALLTTSMTCGIGYLLCIFTQRKQTLHDLLANTVVVRTY